MNNRGKNIYFWLGLIGIVFASAGVDFESLTNWKLLAEALIGIVNNPVALVAVALAIVGVFVDPTTEGLKDKEE